MGAAAAAVVILATVAVAAFCLPAIKPSKFFFASAAAARILYLEVDVLFRVDFPLGLAPINEAFTVSIGLEQLNASGDGEVSWAAFSEWNRNNSIETEIWKQVATVEDELRKKLEALGTGEMEERTARFAEDEATRCLVSAEDFAKVGETRKARILKEVAEDFLKPYPKARGRLQTRRERLQKLLAAEKKP